MSDQNEVTIGEVHRLLVSMSGELKEIKIQTTATNGKVIRNDERIGVLERQHEKSSDTLSKVVLAMFTAVVGGVITLVVRLLS